MFLCKLHKPCVPLCRPIPALWAAAHAHRAAQAPLLSSQLSAWCQQEHGGIFSSARNKRSISSHVVSLWLRRQRDGAPLAQHTARPRL